MERIQTHCKALDALANGGLPTGTITQLFGRRRWERASSPCSRHSPWLRPEGARLSWTLSSHTGTTSSPPRLATTLSRRGSGKEIPVVEGTISRETKQPKKKPITRTQLTPMISTALNQAGVLYVESQLSEIADILPPEVHIEMEKLDGPRVIILEVPEIVDLLSLHGVDGVIVVSEGGLSSA